MWQPRTAACSELYAFPTTRKYDLSISTAQTHIELRSRPPEVAATQPVVQPADNADRCAPPAALRRLGSLWLRSRRETTPAASCDSRADDLRLQGIIRFPRFTGPDAPLLSHVLTLRRAADRVIRLRPQLLADAPVIAGLVVVEVDWTFVCRHREVVSPAVLPAARVGPVHNVIDASSAGQGHGDRRRLLRLSGSGSLLNDRRPVRLNDPDGGTIRLRRESGLCHDGLVDGGAVGERHGFAAQ